MTLWAWVIAIGAGWFSLGLLFVWVWARVRGSTEKEAKETISPRSS